MIHKKNVCMKNEKKESLYDTKTQEDEHLIYMMFVFEIWRYVTWNFPYELFCADFITFLQVYTLYAVGNKVIIGPSKEDTY